MTKFLTTALIAAQAFALAQADETDFLPGRPGNTESPIAVPQGRWQVESELVSHARDVRDGVTTLTTSIAATSFRYGLASDNDAEMITRPYARIARNGIVTEGVGDITLRARRTVLDVHGDAAVAVNGYITAPSSAPGLAVSAVEGRLIATGAMPLTSKLSATFTAAAGALSADNGSHVADYSCGLDVAYASTARLGGYLEVFADKSAGAPVTTVLQAGTTFLLTPTTQLDSGIEPRLGDDTDDYRVFVGWAHRFQVQNANRVKAFDNDTIIPVGVDCVPKKSDGFFAGRVRIMVGKHYSRLHSCPFGQGVAS